VNIHEYQAKGLLRSYGVPVSDGRVVLRAEEAKTAAGEMDGPLWVVKAQIHAGGRGKGHFKEADAGEKGGVRLAKSVEEAATEAKKMLPRGNSRGQYRLRNYCCLMNEATAQDWLKLDRAAVGDDRAGDMFFEGLKTDTILGVKHIFTIKDDLVPDDYVYFFAAPDFLGKCFYVTDWTMFMKKEAWYVEFFNYWLGGFAFGNVAGMAVARFNQTGS